MQVKSISDIPNWLFLPVKHWTTESSDHFNLFVGSGMLLTIVLIIALWWVYRKIGKSDERTDPIYLRAVCAGFVALIMCEVIFPDSYLINQFKVYKYAITLLVIFIYLWRAYRTQFKE
ncbi:DUF2178 domain-containing protein [Lentilactobacillus diolivorans]|uniref:DUF2178 domain-containing protein n=1 Tax=Lentilactobacillus diolivorans TaxID=179838 RepID=UPI002468CBF6|nr:DUF2178 domain-containing protein [Lentilactobacillus diolivorans]MDH5105026.1 DUF2178 domain-containing protein [Lentilactobacillus diolivorans]